MKRSLATALVVTQFLLLAALVLIPHGSLIATPSARIATFVVAGVLGAAALVVLGLSLRGLGSSLTASPIPLENAALVTTGLYGVVRHPIYSGLLLLGLALLLVGASIWHALVWLALVVLLSVKARWEERMLLAAHPGYAAYAARVGRFIPGVGRIRG